MNKDSKVLIVGHNDIIEKGLLNYFQVNAFQNVFSSSDYPLNVLNLKDVSEFFEQIKPEYVFLSSIRSGGIAANQQYPVDFLVENLQSQNTIIHAAYKTGVKKLLFFNSSCTYPKDCPQPMREDSLLTGPLEETSEPYAVAKIAGVKLCQAYRKQYGFNAIVATPATVYGPGSDTDLETAHVMGALIGKFYQAVRSRLEEVVIWGSGRPRREFLFVDDFVKASLFLMQNYEDAGMVNIGCGEDISIQELAKMIADISGFQGSIVFDPSKPDGAMQKLLDHHTIADLGWKRETGLGEGIRKTYAWYKEKMDVFSKTAKK